MESARRASDIHKARTGRALRVTEKDVLMEEMYEEEEGDIRMQYQRLSAHLHASAVDFRRQLDDFVNQQIAVRTRAQFAQNGLNGPTGSTVQTVPIGPNVQTVQTVPTGQMGQLGQNIDMMIHQGLAQFASPQNFPGQMYPMMPSPMEAQQHLAQQQMPFLQHGQPFMPHFPGPYPNPGAQLPVFQPFSPPQNATIGQFQQGQLNMFQAGFTGGAEDTDPPPDELFVQPGIRSMISGNMDDMANHPQMRPNPPAEYQMTTPAMMMGSGLTMHEQTRFVDPVDDFIVADPLDPSEPGEFNGQGDLNGQN